MKSKLSLALLAALCLGWSAHAAADINVGITVSATGNGAPLGLPQKNTTALLPAAIAGEKVNWFVLDDATDPTQASKNARKFVSDNRVDVIIGSSITPNTIPIMDIAVETKTPLLALTPHDLAGDRLNWTFCFPQHIALMSKAIADHMAAAGYKSVAAFAQSDPYGDVYLKELTKAGEPHGIKVIAVERFNRSDTSATGQAIKLVTAKPDAVLIVAGASAGAMAQLGLVARGYKGQIYQTHGAANRDILRLGGKGMEGTIFAAGPLVVWNQLPDSHPSKKVGGDYAKRYEDMYGANTMGPQGGHLWDAVLVLQHATPAALKKGRPGTPEFRQALRDAVESERNMVVSHGVLNMSATDHFGHDERARVLLRVENGAFKLVSGK